jgi:hypothetical protein
MHCERCGAEAPCMRVTLFQNVGAVILRFTSTVSGMLCKRCIDACTVRMSAISFFFGWWGVISFFVNAVTLPLNVVTWLRSLSLPAAPAAPLDPYAPASAPAARSGADVLALVSLALGAVAILVTLLFAMLGVGMMVAPNHPEDVQSGMICMVTSALICGLPGAIGLGAGIFRLRRRSSSR